MTAEQTALVTGNVVLLYDGHCGLCNGMVRFCARRDSMRRIRYAPLQSEVGKELLGRYGETPESLGSMAIFLEAMTPGERFFHHSDAAAWALRQLPAPWKWVGRVVGWTPRLVRDAIYAVVARLRYVVFGRYPVCPIPSPEMRSRFVDVADEGCVRA